MPKKLALREKLLKKTKEEVKEFYLDRSIHIIKAVSMLTALDECFNLLLEGIKEWFSINFPELEKEIKSNELYLKLLSVLGERKNFSKKNLLAFSLDEKVISVISLKAEQSIGSDISIEDVQQIKSLAEKILLLRQERESLSKYIELQMKKELPNFTAVAGPLIGAKLLSLAGSKKKLALMPASTIQLLGAEKALFSSLKNKSKTPKHGIIFNHPMVVQVKKKNKGKMARTLASKLSIAVKADFFGKKDVSKELLKTLNNRFKQLKE